MHLMILHIYHRDSVAPFAGAWIEITSFVFCSAVPVVAPFAGAWIEMYLMILHIYHRDCRSLRGSVD